MLFAAPGEARQGLKLTWVSLVLIWWGVSGCAALTTSTDPAWPHDQQDFRYLATIAQYAADAYQCQPAVEKTYEKQFQVRYFYEKFFGKEVGCRFEGVVTFHRAYALIPICRGEGACGKERIIAIKGSETLGDWLVNFTLSPFQDPKFHAEYHEGFRVAATKLLADIKAWRPIEPEELITITGHSKGGAIALSLFHLLLDSGHPPNRLRLITFGQPKVGANTSHQHPERILRLVNQGDPVPEIPPNIKELGLKYEHSGRALYLVGKGKWSHQPPRKEFFGFTLSLTGTNLSDHNMARYTEQLRQIAENCYHPTEEPDSPYQRCRVGPAP